MLTEFHWDSSAKWTPRLYKYISQGLLSVPCIYVASDAVSAPKEALLLYGGDFIVGFVVPCLIA